MAVDMVTTQENGPGANRQVPESRSAGVGLTGKRSLTIALLLGYFGVWVAFFSPVLLTLPLRIEQLAPGHKALVLSIVLGISAVFGLLAGPIAGARSDRCRSRWGRRRPWLLGSMLIGVAGLFTEAFGPNVVLVGVGVCLVAIGFGASVAVLLVVIAEQASPQRRGAISGWLGIGQSVAVVVGLAIGGGLSASSIALAFVVPGLLGTVGLVALCLVLPDPGVVTDARPRLTARELLNAFWMNPKLHPDFAWAWLSRFMLFMAFAGIINYQVYYLSDQLGVSTADTAKYVGIGTGLQVVMVIISSAAAGRVSDRLGRRKVFVMSSAALGVVALIVLALAQSLPLFFVGVALIGLAQGTYYSVDLALVADILARHKPDSAPVLGAVPAEHGKEFGIFTLANQVPQSLAPAIAPLFLAVSFGSVAHSGDNYTMLFVGGGAFALISAVAITRVRGVR